MAAVGKESKKRSSLKRNNRQSPINICATVVLRDPSLSSKRLQIHYETGEADLLKVSESGFTCFMREPANSSISGLHIDQDADYRLWQFHMHWSDKGDCGSEHCINGKYFAGELHFVFWNANLGTRERAMKKSEGLVVLGVFVQAEKKDNPHLESIIEAVERATLDKEKCARVSDDFDLTKVLPEKRFYYTYHGSLTTPPFSECVNWTLLRRPIGMGERQFEVLRRLTKNNVRALQALHERKVYSSFQLVAKAKRST